MSETPTTAQTFAFSPDPGARTQMFLPSTLVRVRTGLLQADSGETLAECFFIATSSDWLSSPLSSSTSLRLVWYKSVLRPLDFSCSSLIHGNLPLSSAVPSAPS
ncbi:hypothetical protein DPEC_G00327040 [Dallia pectoralis]|uniref:Uncharacterized protein n=1 Tax=Dallia pectoralis TaxID=75939 RepID=A0ACC2F805_DALPE|nr:hypothetical protein DPEC_G00327040 [Dallia pectoralis]